MAAHAHSFAPAADLGRESRRDELQPLVEAMARGEDAALGSLYDLTSSRVLGMALRILGDRPTAEETVLDVYGQAWQQASRFDPARGSVLAWLLTLARSRAIDLRRARGRRVANETGSELLAALQDPDMGPEERSATHQTARRVHHALEILPPLQRQAITSAFFDGMTHAEIAETLRTPLGTIKTRIRSGLLTLRDVLAKDQVSHR